MEVVYIEMVSNCKKAISGVERFMPDFGTTIFFPDHIEPENQEDDMLMCPEYYVAELKRSLRQIQQAMNEYNDCFDQDVRNVLLRFWKLDKLDESIAKLREARIEAERRAWNSIQRKTPQNEAPYPRAEES
jgi:hypothetical protein